MVKDSLSWTHPKCVFEMYTALENNRHLSFFFTKKIQIKFCVGFLVAYFSD